MELAPLVRKLGNGWRHPPSPSPPPSPVPLSVPSRYWAAALLAPLLCPGGGALFLSE